MLCWLNTVMFTVDPSMWRPSPESAMIDAIKASNNAHACASLYEAYAQATLSLHSIDVDLHDLCGFRRYMEYRPNGALRG